MTKAELFEELELILNEEEGFLNEKTELESLAGWDSTGLLGIIALLDGELGIDVDVEKLRACVTISDLVAIIDDKLE